MGWKYYEGKYHFLFFHAFWLFFKYFHQLQLVTLICCENGRVCRVAYPFFYWKLQDKEKNVSTALNVTGSSTTASIYLATISLTLCSLIGAWIANSTNAVFESNIIYGDTRSSTMSIKYISLLTCFLLAFSCFVQSARHLVHVSYLISNPSSDIHASTVELSVIRGGELWSLGLRALYFALNLLLWFFGPIPMFVSSIILVIILHHLDFNSKEYGSEVSQTTKRNGQRSV